MIDNTVSHATTQLRHRPGHIQGLTRRALGYAESSAKPGTRQGIHLTPRQSEVLALLCEGFPNKLICRRLNISAGTAKAHISSILRELGVSSRLQAVVEAGRRGLLGERCDEASNAAAPTGDPLVMPFNLLESESQHARLRLFA
jgi:DNA-binding NarL/FixJ family response regulator